MISLLVLSAVAQTAGTPPDQHVTVTGPEERRICRQVGADHSSATRISRRRVCRTAAEWQQAARSNPDSDGGEAAADRLDTISRAVEARTGQLGGPR